MAWLQDLATKTETLLDKIDKSANNLFNETNELDSGRCSSSQINEDNLQENQIDFQTDFLNISDSQKNEEFDTNFEWYKTEVDILQSNYEDKMIELENDNEKLRQELLKLQHNFAEVSNENQTLKNQIQQAKDCVLTVENEMKNYKSKVRKVLNNKDNLFVDEILNKNGLNKNLQEKIDYLEELNNILSLKVQTLTQNLNNLQNEYKNLQNSNSFDFKNLQNNLENERKLRILTENENKEKNVEIKALSLELNNQLKIFEEKNKECEILKESINKSEEKIDLTLRIQSLTETLISKQNTLETLSTEKTVLKLQLEKIRSEHFKLIEENKKKEIEMIKPIKKLKKSEELSSRCCIYFSRSKLSRYIIFIYFILLHFWVFIIICFYVPK